MVQEHCLCYNQSLKMKLKEENILCYRGAMGKLKTEIEMVLKKCSSLHEGPQDFVLLFNRGFEKFWPKSNILHPL